MGLDHGIDRYTISSKGKGKDISLQYSRDELAVFRKSNWLHQYVVNAIGGGDNSEAGITLDVVVSLRDKLHKTIETFNSIMEKKDPKYVKIIKDSTDPDNKNNEIKQLTKRAEKLLERYLPPAEGFFFGETKFYLEDDETCFIIERMKYDLEQIRKVEEDMIMNKSNPDVSYLYWSWW
jgi:hypothetical protein